MNPKIIHFLIAALSGNLLLEQWNGGGGTREDFRKERIMAQIKLGEDAKMMALPERAQLRGRMNILD